MLERLKDLRAQALEELGKVDQPRELELWRVRYLGKKSNLIQILRSLAELPLEKRREAGAQANETKRALESSLEEKARLLRAWKRKQDYSRKLFLPLLGNLKE